MNLQTRITRLFLLRIFLLIGINILVCLLIIYLAYQFIREPDYNDPRELMKEAAEQTQLVGDQVLVSQSILQELRKSDSWLQILDETGNEIYQQDRPNGIPTHYSPSELTDYQQGLIKTGYRYHTWYGIKGTGKQTKRLTWVYARPIPNVQLLQQVIHVTGWEKGEVTIPATMLDQLQDKRAWLQIIDEEGRQIYQYNKPDTQPEVYSPGHFVYYKTQGTGMQYFTGELANREVTWVLGAERLDLGNEYSPFNQVLTLILVICALTITFYMAILFGQRLGAPLIHMMNWIEQLGSGRLKEPVDRQGIPKSLDPVTGDTRRPYRMYEELIRTLQGLTQTLRRNQAERLRLERTREEWMAGISHDLKTPLSSVKGYANLLTQSSYQWEEAEVQHHAQIIQNKAQYMERLMEDLTLTFRLKNEALPLNKQPKDMVELVRRSVIDLANSPQAEGYPIEFVPHTDPIIYSVDEKWLIRALTNLLINSVVHNPPGTGIQIEIGYRDDDRLYIRIEDNGQGMDQETIQHLFERYYRGTHTRWKADGTGLGMAIANQLIQAHGGGIEVESELGKGTRIWIYFQVK